MKVINRKDAARLGMVRYYTGKLCAHGHDAERFVSSGACLECQRLTSAKYYQEIRELSQKARAAA